MIHSLISKEKISQLFRKQEALEALYYFHIDTLNHNPEFKLFQSSTKLLQSFQSPQGVLSIWNISNIISGCISAVALYYTYSGNCQCKSSFLLRSQSSVFCF